MPKLIRGEMFVRLAALFFIATLPIPFSLGAHTPAVNQIDGLDDMLKPGNALEVFCNPTCRRCRHSQNYCFNIAQASFETLCKNAKHANGNHPQACYFLWQDLVNTCNEMCTLP